MSDSVPHMRRINPAKAASDEVCRDRASVCEDVK